MESSSRAFKWDQSERSQFFRYKVKAVFVKGLFSKGEVRGSNQGGADQVSVNFINLWSSNTTRLLEIAMHHFFWDTLYLAPSGQSLCKKVGNGQELLFCGGRPEFGWGGGFLFRNTVPIINIDSHTDHFPNCDRHNQICDGSWHHYTLSASPEEANLFIDGHQVQPSPLQSSATTTKVNIMMIRRIDEPFLRWRGAQVDEGEDIVEDWRVHQPSPLLGTTLMVILFISINIIMMINLIW